MGNLVSVVVITYQHANYIKQCLESILMQQTDFDFEIILGEDESSDGTRDICIEYANKYPEKIRLFLRSRKDVLYINGNPTGRFNFIECIKEAKGKYISFCEGDDYWVDPLKLQKQIDFLEANPDYTIVASNTNVVNIEGDITKVINNPTATFSIEDMIKTNFLGHATNTVVFKRTLLSSEAIQSMMGSPVGDWLIWLIMLEKGKGYYMADILGTYRMHGNGAWSGKSADDKIKTMLQIYDFMLTVFPNYSLNIQEAKANYILAFQSKKKKAKKSVFYKIYKKIFK
ncbi:MAG: glycosyltransferase [Bacteroidota bacterium]|nr:glycosyltransferase [Bacteroidota bacterium]